MSAYSNPSGKTTIAPEVLVDIARQATLDIPGVAHMAPVAGGVNRLFRRGTGDGVRILVGEGGVEVNLYVVLQDDVNIREIGRKIQETVARAIHEILGMDVLQVDIHVEDIAYKAADEA